MTETLTLDIKIQATKLNHDFSVVQMLKLPPPLESPVLLAALFQIQAHPTHVSGNEKWTEDGAVGSEKPSVG